MADRGEGRDELIYMAKLSEQTERFDEMVDYMKRLVQQGQELKDEERNLLSIAYKNAVGNRRTAWRALTAYEMKEKQKNNKHIAAVQFYRKRIEKELEVTCREILQILDKQLTHTKQAESIIFYYKMKGDYNRYLAEFQSGDSKEKTIGDAEAAYKQAMELLDSDGKAFTKTNPLRLGVALNYSVFYYEIKGDLQQACNKAKAAFEDAVNELDDLEEEQFKDSTTILQLLRDNLTAWQTELQEEGDRN